MKQMNHPNMFVNSISKYQDICFTDIKKQIPRFKSAIKSKCGVKHRQAQNGLHILLPNYGAIKYFTCIQNEFWN